MLLVNAPEIYCSNCNLYTIFSFYDYFDINVSPEFELFQITLYHYEFIKFINEVHKIFIINNCTTHYTQNIMIRRFKS